MKNPDGPAGSISMISSAERRMIDAVNNTGTDYSRDKTIIHLFEETAVLYPENTALTFEGNVLTYADVKRKSDLLAELLRTFKIGSGDYVGVLLRRSPELILCLLAIIKTGAAYVPLNITDPENRILSIIKAADIKFIIQNSRNEMNLKGDLARLNIEQLIDQSGKLEVTNNNIISISTDPAYIIFTSGTTGTPKGVLVSHKSVINIIEWVNNTFKISQKDKLLWITNLSFDLSVYDIFGILAAGGMVRIVSDEDRQNPEKQYEIILNEGITFWDSAPQSLQLLTPFFDKKANPQSHNSLRLVFLSGDWIPLSLPATVSSVFPSASVVGLGGATEATIWSNYFIIDRIEPEWKSIPYGKPVQNARYYILDEKMNHCCIQKPGDLYIGGECLALGYYNDKELTGSRFIQDPFNTGSKLYLTGDKAQWMADGNIEFLGREDEQVKIRGYRVETGEIKSIVLKNKTIKDAVVIPDISDRHNIKIILFITTYDDRKLDIRDLKQELLRWLPEYMIPADVVQLLEFPVTGNGKIDTKSLLAGYYTSLNNNQIKNKTQFYETDNITLTSTEKALYKIWSEALQNRKISTTDNFFEVGGNSFIAISIINQINEELSYDLSFRDFITYPTILQSADYIESRSENSDKAIKLIHLTETKNLPLSFNQKRLWLISKLQPNIPSYIISNTYRFTGSLNQEVFQRSIDILFRRHQIVYSVIKEVNDEPYCDIVPSKVKVSFFDWSGLPENDRLKRVNDLIDADSREIFDLEIGPLYRCYLMMTGSDEYYFHLSIHHIIFDGWSWSVLAQDFNTIYNSLFGGRESRLEEIEFQQYDYAHWEKSFTGSKNETGSIDFWKDNLQGVSPVLNFPYDFQRRNLPSGRGSYEIIKLSKEMSEKIRKISKEENSSLFTTLLSIFGIQMQKYSGEDDFNIGLPVAYRPHTRLEKIFGMFVNTVVVRLRYEKESTFRDIIRMTDEAALNAIAHQDLPFEKVVEIANPERSPNINPLFQVAFIWQNNPDVPFNLEGIRSEKIPRKERNSIFDITMSLWENESIIEGEIAYNTDILKRDTIIRLRDNFLNLFDQLIENSDTAVESLSMISDREKKMIESINNTRTNYPKEKTIIRLFEDQVSVYGDKKAVVFKEESLTYKQLNEKANQLARVLRKSGVGVGSPVGILVEKSVTMIVGILGILKAGGGYVPIDPEYPVQRLNFILRDSGCRILLTQNKYLNVPAEGVAKLSLDSITSYHNDKSDVEGINVSADLAYILYTSGTTGKPKGSMIPQYSVVRLVRNTNYIDFSSEDRILQASAIVFDISTTEIWAALLNGGTLYIIDKETLLDPNALGEVLIRHNITFVNLTPSLVNQIVETRTDIFNRVKTLIIGGDVLSAPHINRLRKENPQLSVINAYGPTENTCTSTTYKIDRDFNLNIPIGKPISNSTAYIFDRQMNYQPVGVVGELYVGGDGLSTGYLNREELNKACFTEHPCSRGERLYRTGDLARWLPDGNIEFHGRVDNQLKIRGFRVELEEIESIISEIDGVVETVVKPVKVEEGDYRLVAFLNVQPSFNLDTKEIGSRINEKLPAYMVPAAYKFIHRFPRTVSGKVDRKSLFFEIKELVTKDKKDVNTFTPNEKLILNLWSKTLKTEEITVSDNFFDVGGSSLLAINLANLVSKEFNVVFKAMTIFEFPTIRAQSEYLSGKAGDRIYYKNTEIDEKVRSKKKVNFKRLRKQ